MRSAYGLDAEPDTTAWRREAACRLDPDMFFTEASERAAVHVCMFHCPVWRDCATDAARTRPVLGVQAGVLWVLDHDTHRGRPSAYQPARAGHGAHCDRWGGGV